MLVLPPAPFTDDNDELSTCSTKQEEFLPAKSVTFDERPPVEYSHPFGMSKEERQAELWYSPAELQHLKAASIHLAKAIAKHDRTITDARSYHKMVGRAFGAAEADQRMSPIDQTHFSSCLNLSPTRLGLERITVREVCKAQHKRRAALLSRVRVIQEMEGLDPNKKQVILRMQCEKITRTSRVFARQLAEGLYGVQEQQQDEKIDPDSLPELEDEDEEALLAL